MKKVFIVEGGIGKNILFTSILKNIEEEVYVMTAYPDIYIGFKNIIAVQFGYSFDFEVELLHFEPYWNSDCFYKKRHLKDIWVDGLNKLYNLDLKADTLPKLKIFEVEKLRKDVESYVNLLENQDYIIVQFTGQQSPLTYNERVNYQYNPKNYNQSQKLINSIKSKYPNLKILAYGLPNEIGDLNGVIKLNIPYLFWFYLLRDAKTFIAIDSSLQHAAAGINKKGIVIWKNTPVEVMGWDIHINLKSENAGYWRPYVRQIDAFDKDRKLKHYQGKEVDVETIINELNKILKENKNG